MVINLLYVPAVLNGYGYEGMSTVPVVQKKNLKLKV